MGERYFGKGLCREDNGASTSHNVVVCKVLMGGSGVRRGSRPVDAWGRNHWGRHTDDIRNQKQPESALVETGDCGECGEPFMADFV